MFDSLKIKSECNLFLKKYNIKIDEEFHIYKKGPLIHCQVMDWRGPIEVEGFPVISINTAIAKIIELSIFDHFLKKEVKKRKELKKNFSSLYGDYEFRKYWFEESLKIIKEYSDPLFKKLVKKYTSLINKNRNIKSKWKYNFSKLQFEPREINRK
jgi:hypothetical protein